MAHSVVFLIMEDVLAVRRVLEIMCDADTSWRRLQERAIVLGTGLAEAVGELSEGRITHE